MIICFHIYKPNMNCQIPKHRTITLDKLKKRTWKKLPYSENILEKRLAILCGKFVQTMSQLPNLLPVTWQLGPPHRFTWRRYWPFFRSWKRESPFHVTWIREMLFLRDTGKVVFFSVISWKHRFLVCISWKIWTILTV